MLRSETEYRLAVQRLQEQLTRFEEQKAACEAAGMSPDECDRVLQPLESFRLELQEEIQDYERLKRGEFDPVANLRGIGTLLVRMRIASGLSQKDLADRLGVDPSMVSRDERNEYHGVTLERAQRILEVLGVEAHTTVELAEPAAA